MQRGRVRGFLGLKPTARSFPDGSETVKTADNVQEVGKHAR